MIKIDLNKFPTKPGVYIWKQKNKVLYVGKANNLRKRLEQYFRTGIGVWKEQMVSKADSIDYFLSSNEEEALILEEKLVKQYNPLYNCLLKGDSKYVYIRIGEGQFPKIDLTHYKDKKGTYIGPKVYKKDLKDILLLLRRILKFRTCSDNKFSKGKICSDYTLSLCKGWCSVYKNMEEYKSILNIVKKFFKGKVDEVKKLILNKIDNAVEKENFEYASILKDIYLKLFKFEQRQTIELDEKITGYFIKIKKEKNIYFMVYMYFVDGKLIDIVKLYDDENNFLQTMKNDGLITSYKILGENYYYAK